LQKFGFGYSPRQIQGVGKKEEVNVKGFIRVTEHCVVTERERERCSGKNLTHRIESEKGVVSSHCAFGVDSKRLVVAPETIVLTMPSPA
jgi:hypothetical protein